MTSDTALVLGVGLLAFAAPLWFVAPVVWRAWRRRRVRRLLVDELHVHKNRALIDALNASTDARRRQLDAIVASPVSPRWISDHIYRAGKTGHRS